MRLVMIGEHTVHTGVFRGKTIRDGEEFDVPDGEAHIWKNCGWAREIAPEEQKRRGRYSRRDMRAENTRDMSLDTATEDE